MPVDSGWPASRFAALLDRGALQNQNQLDADLQGWLSEEHKANGEHGDIVADSITLNPADPGNALTGKVIVQDEDEKQTQFYRTRALGTIVDLLDFTFSDGRVYVTIRYESFQGLITELVKLGIISHGSGSGQGIQLSAIATGLPDVYHDWSIVSGNTNAAPGARMLIGDITRSLSPLALRWRNSGSGIYEWMKTTGAEGPTSEDVNLGSDLDGSAAGFWNKAFIRRVKMQSVANGSEWVGEWQNVPFNAGNFTANGAMTWTVASGDATGYRWTMVGNTMTLAFYLGLTSVGGTPDVQLRIAIPGGYTAAGLEHNTVFISDNGTLGVGQAIAGNGNAFIAIYKQDESPWTASTDNTAVRGQITFAIA